MKTLKEKLKDLINKNEWEILKSKDKNYCSKLRLENKDIEKCVDVL